MNSQYYELMYVIPLKFAGETLQPTVDDVQSKLEELKAEVHKHEQFGKLKFSYKIDHQHQGFYYIVEFTASTDVIKALHTWLQLKKEVLRFIIVKKVPGQRTSLDVGKEQLQEQAKQSQEETGHEAGADDTPELAQEDVVEEKDLEKKEESKKPAKKVSQPKKEKSSEKKEEDNKITLEEIDQKLDEILDSDIPTI